MRDPLYRRLMRIERHMTGGHTSRQIQQWREELAECFADATYDAHRGELIEALCTGDPEYCMDLPAELHGRPATAHYFITWPDRGVGAPDVTVFIMPTPELDPEGTRPDV